MLGPRDACHYRVQSMPSGAIERAKMRIQDDQLTISATDFAAHFECAHKTTLELGVARKELQRPSKSEVERLILEERGRKHEARVLEFYRGQGLRVVELETGAGAEGTLDAMREGADVIYQAVLGDGAWSGRPDFLVRAAKSSDGVHLYEPVDAKLAREERAKAILQLCIYAELLSAIQGIWPENLWLALGVSPIAPVAFPSSGFRSYFRQARAVMGGATTNSQAASYPEPCEHCNVCDWWKHCDEHRRSDDHLSLVAGITRRQRSSLIENGVSTLAKLATLAPERRVEGIDDEPLTRIRTQARLQHSRRVTHEPRYELILDGDSGTGLEMLPEPRPGDLFLDLEGDAFVAEGGLEYLFGLLELGPPGDIFDTRKEAGVPQYLSFWATNPLEEKRAFEAVMDRIVRGREEFPDLHIYHFGHRENDALKRLSCRHGIREREVDDLLREGLMIDLHKVVKQGIRASVESYTLKEMEVFHGFEREVSFRDAAKAMQHFGWWLETRDVAIDDQALRHTLARYNEEDCRSTWKLRDWLEERRSELVRARGAKVERPAAKKAATNAEESTSETADLAKTLLAGPMDDSERSARQLLADLLDWHWREAKATWWEYYDARESSPSEWREHRLVLDGLEYEGVVGSEKSSHVHRYRFPQQEHGIRRLPTPQVAGESDKAANVVKVGPDFVDIKRGRSSKDPHPTALKPGKPLGAENQKARLRELAESVVQHGLGRDPAHAVATHLLLREAPRCGQQGGEPLLDPERDIVDAVNDVCCKLNASVLSIQGPPGSGKTHSAAEAILALVAAGKRVGVMANSHQVILGVLNKVSGFATKRSLGTRIHHIGDPAEHVEQPFVVGKDYAGVLEALRARQLDVVGGTIYAWSREEFRGAVDVLFVDEAGQISLANTLSVAHAGQSLVLIGDPAQLDQPKRGVHPPGADVSALEYILGDAKTMPADRGIFLPITRRLHPDICAYTSRIFYEDRLKPLSGLERQAIVGSSRFEGSGLRYISVPHRGNTNTSPEEVEMVAQIAASFLDGSNEYVDSEGRRRPLVPADIVVVAPYNAQVVALRAALPENVEVGTVDKFQGKEAPLVIYSMTTSSGDEAPRGLEFLYSLNRLNVATSRGKALAILVASPALLDARCKTPRQLQLVNALCAFVEMAKSDPESKLE